MRVLLTIDVEAHRVVDEISGKRHDSLGRVLSLLEAHSVKGTFFVDLCEVETWGEAVIGGRVIGSLSRAMTLSYMCIRIIAAATRVDGC